MALRSVPGVPVSSGLGDSGLVVDVFSPFATDERKHRSASPSALENLLLATLGSPSVVDYLRGVFAVLNDIGGSLP